MTRTGFRPHQVVYSGKAWSNMENSLRDIDELQDPEE